jgi:hypothetical protein
LQETNQLTTQLFFGAAWVALTDDAGVETGVYRLDLSSTPTLQEISLVVDWSQADVLYRCVIPRAMVSDRGAIQLQRTAAQTYELTVDALDFNGSLGYVLTNDNILGTGNAAASVQPFSASVIVPEYASNNASTGAWTARVATANQTGPAVVSLLNAAGTGFDVQNTLTQDGTYDVTVPQGTQTAEIKVTHGGVDFCFAAEATAQAATSKTCTVVTG